MLLFSDGFDHYHIYDLMSKWGHFGQNTSYPLYAPEARIVSGIDPAGNKPWATKNGRALYLGSQVSQLKATFRPSRTIYAGFAFRCRCSSYVDIKIQFGTKEEIEHGGLPFYNGGTGGQFGSRTLRSAGDLTSPAGSLVARISPNRVSYTWTFPGGTTKVADINTSMNLLSGDYHYIQAGMTLMGNVSALPEAWCELRIGNRPSGFVRHQNTLTSTPDGAGSFYMDCLSFQFNVAYDYHDPPYTTIDDVYIANDEGTINNGFLGNVKVRSVTPSADGSDNDAVPTLKSGDARRFQAVDEDLIGTTPLPSPIPTPEQDPLFLPWENPFDDYLTLEHRGDRQSFRFHSVDYAGSSPVIMGAILHGLAVPTVRGMGGKATLKGYKRTGLIPLVAAQPTDVPLTYERSMDYVCYDPNTSQRRTWQNYAMVFQNDEVVQPGQFPLIWNGDTLNNSEFVIELADCELDPAMYDRNLVRFNLDHYEICSEFLGFVELVHRYFDAAVAESIGIVDSQPLYERTFKVVDSLYWAPEISLYRTFHKSLNDEIKMNEVIPWIYFFVQGQLAIEDEIFLEWQDLVAESLAAEDWSSGFWEEVFNDQIDLSGSAAASFIERLEELFGLEEPYLWNGHEDVEETMGIGVSYLRDNHELMEEYLYPGDATSNGFGLDIAEVIDFAEEHHDGWPVELLDQSLVLTESILTQHWRYERFFGIVISSWQITPVEQQGQDGNHTGDNPWGW